MTDDRLKTYTLADIEVLLQSSGKSLSDYPPIPIADTALVYDLQNHLIHDELSYDKVDWTASMIV